MSADEEELRRLFGELADRQAVHGTDGAWLRARLRRRRARQGALAGGLFVAALVGAMTISLPDGEGAVVTATEPPSAAASASPDPSPSPAPSPQSAAVPPPVPPQLTATTGASLLVVQGTRLELLDVDSGRRTTLPTVPQPNAYDRLDAVIVDGELVLVGDNNTGAGTGPFPVYATTAGPGSSLREIGQASTLQPSDRRGRVWLVSDLDTNSEEAGTTLTEVDLTGHVFRQARFAQQFGVRPFADGYLRPTRLPDGTTGENTELVDGNGHRLDLYPASSVVIVRGDTAVLEGVQPCDPCRLQVLTGDPANPRDVTFASLPFLADVGLTTDATRLYTSVHGERLQDPQQALLYSRITELDLKQGTSRAVADAWSATYYGASFQFSQDGRWMFFIDADAKSIDAYDLQARRAYRVPGNFATITQLALL